MPLIHKKLIANCQSSMCEQHYKNMMQEADRPQKYYSNTGSNPKFDNKDKPMVIDNENNKINNFLPCANQDIDKRVSTEITQHLQRHFKDGFTRIGCFDETFS